MTVHRLERVQLVPRPLAEVFAFFSRPGNLEQITPPWLRFKLLTAETLRRWRHNFTGSFRSLDALGYDERFRRLWTLYLAYCEARFAERRICDIQLLLSKPRSQLAARAGLRGTAIAATGAGLG